MAEANREQPEDARIVFRIGLHLGDLIVDGDELYGDGVNVAARLEAEASPGGIIGDSALQLSLSCRAAGKRFNFSLPLDPTAPSGRPERSEGPHASDAASV